ncbi:hypothetical protein DKX38_023769 [Salix brachista]|uniref:Uncharacterized protein n=1 Tax=Salix brachista TaxID=2182728 RepID=A0A5N5JPV1_9ROSI|nr:hypothetical protein DKX38_023769 [Salix brachista]
MPCMWQKKIKGLAYEYARRGARLAQVARREDRLRVVAYKARELGSPEVFDIRADAAKVEECKRIVDEINRNDFRQARQPYVLPGLIESEITVPDSLSEFQAKFLPPFESTKQCAEAIVQSACRGDMYLTEPSWWNALSMLKLLRPELVEWFYRWNFMNGTKIKQL